MIYVGGVLHGSKGPDQRIGSKVVVPICLCYPPYIGAQDVYAYRERADGRRWLGWIGRIMPEPGTWPRWARAGTFKASGGRS